MTRLLLAFLLALPPLAQRGAVTDRTWQSGTWQPAKSGLGYVIRASTFRLELEDAAPGEKRLLEVTNGAPVRFAVEEGVVYVMDPAQRGAAEKVLKLTRRVDEIYRGAGDGRYIKAIGSYGQFVTLDDDSVWEVHPQSRGRVGQWMLEQGISVRPTEPDNGYNYQIDNADADGMALGRYSPP